MVLTLSILFWLGFLGMIHTYVLYPLIVSWQAKGKHPNDICYSEEEEWPEVSIMMSIYNEERVIEEKMESLVHLEYPSKKLNIYIGSDCSSDRTNEIVSIYAEKYARVHFYPFEERRGKPGVVNELYEKVSVQVADHRDHVLIITDASVMMEPLTLKQMVKHFKNPKIGLVDSHIIHTGIQKAGISKVEDHYISSEAKLKNKEGIAWGKMIGPFGGCYALRLSYFSEVPSNYLVDDFYITMRMFEQGADAINELAAICYEGVSHEIYEEYRRKSRISAGNFQNLFTFPHLWWPPINQLGFAFFSHKVLRWLGPFLIIIMVLSALALSLSGNLLYISLLSLLITILIIAPIADYLLKKIGFNIMPLRSSRYFVMMNLALLEGFFKFIKGVRSNVWQPTKRN